MKRRIAAIIALACMLNPTICLSGASAEGVTPIGDYAFECCGAWRSATLPETLVTIGEGAFSAGTTFAENALSPSNICGVSIDDDAFDC